MSGATIVWFRRDLRVADNPALVHAASVGTRVLPIYLADWERDDRWKPGLAGRWWLNRSLAGLADSLASLGAPLVIVSGPPEQVLRDLAKTLGARAVVWNKLHEPYSRDLDRRVAAGLEQDGVEWRTFEAGLLFAPEDHVSHSGRPFVQFTPYWRHCLSLPEPDPPLAAPQRLLMSPGRRVTDEAAAEAPGTAAGAAEAGTGVPEWQPAPESADWRPGEEGAWLRLESFVECCLAAYENGRDLMGTEGTSRLSPHLHFGEVGPRQVWHAIRRAEEEIGRQEGRMGRGAGAAREAAAAFRRQLGWREFAHYILHHFPRTPEQPFRPEFARFPWQEDPAGLDAWKWGATGFPLVDASAGQLLAEGWVHNRARMVSASFLTKDLLIPWQEGAAWYWDRLIDADLANNILGWQWTAGSGPDAAPYFRVFNPSLQARRFDPLGAYVNRWAGEAARAARPIVDHAEARARALAAFRGMRSGNLDRKGLWPLPRDIQV